MRCAPAALGEAVQVLEVLAPSERRSVLCDGAALLLDGLLVPGCSRAAVHAHPVVYRSRGGGHRSENLISRCAAHHLHGA